MIRHNFAVFIISHGRADNVLTLEMLREKVSYSGKIYIVCDDGDDQLAEYKALSGVDDVLIFNKAKYREVTDPMNNFPGNKGCVYARNACWDFAEKLGIEYFLELDDDYTSFVYRYERETLYGVELVSLPIRDFDSLVNCTVNYLKSSNITCLAYAQGGDFIGGIQSAVWKYGCRRKVMNTFFCATKRRFPWLGQMNEDITTSTLGTWRGDIFLTISKAAIIQPQTQLAAGGMTELYKAAGCFEKPFYTVMAAPSCAKISMLNTSHARVHHKICYDFTAPKIISPEYKKA